jgi:hypothetical protein
MPKGEIGVDLRTLRSAAEPLRLAQPSLVSPRPSMISYLIGLGTCTVRPLGFSFLSSGFYFFSRPSLLSISLVFAFDVFLLNFLSL